MGKFTIAIVMLVWGITLIFGPVEDGEILGNIWLLGSILLAWMPKPQ